MLLIGWAGFIGAGMVAMYFLGNPLWSGPGDLFHIGGATADTGKNESGSGA